MDSPKASDGSRFSIGLVVLGSAIVAATLVAGQTYLSMLHHGHDWWRLFSWQLISWSFWAALAPWLLSQGERALRAPRIGWIAANLGLCLLLVAVHIVISALALVWLQPFVPVESMGMQRALRYLLVPWAFIDLLVFWLVIASGNVLASQRRNRELAIRESRLETELARAQLEALRLQIQPHFLFNTLNSIAALVRKRANDQALEMVLGLSQLLRVTLDGSDDPFVTLEDELDFVN